MKKVSILVVVVILIATALCGCSTKVTPASPSENKTVSTSEEIDISIFPEVEASSKNLDVYRQEVSRRTENAQGDDMFISYKDWDVIQLCWDDSDIITKTNVSLVSFDKLYKETSKYYFPVVFRYGESLILWYTDKDGSVLVEKLYGYWNGVSNYMGEAHTDAEGIVLENHFGATILYNQETGEVDHWSYGKKVGTTIVPKGGVFCGHSEFEGHIFRVGSDVYALRTGLFEEGHQVECIAHNVQYVIDADYYYGSDPWSQPLFLMEDGSIKCYISWEGDENATPDDISHLCDLQYEGSWDK